MRSPTNHQAGETDPACAPFRDIAISSSTNTKHGAGRFFNCGVAEANMMAWPPAWPVRSAPVVYTIARHDDPLFEQIRVDVLPQGSVISRNRLRPVVRRPGPDHHSCETWRSCGPCRHGRDRPGRLDRASPRLARGFEADGRVHADREEGRARIHASDPEFRIGRSITIHAGTDACLISTGVMAPVAMTAARILGERGISRGWKAFTR